jgi:ubiquitin-conjugating enzyme E2 D/E
MALRRIRKELDSYSKDPIPGTRLEPDLRYPGSLYHLLAAIIGPANTPYEDCLYFLSLALPPDYPFKPPKVTLLTSIYHPNINKSGYNCLDIYFNWSPVVTLRRILSELLSLLEDPNPEDPLEPEIARLCKTNPAEFRRLAREKALLHAW